MDTDIAVHILTFVKRGKIRIEIRESQALAHDVFYDGIVNNP